MINFQHSLQTRTSVLIMGIVNVTPDSFFDGGQFSSQTAAMDHALRLIEDGAHVLDIGGESTRPGAEAVSEQEELDRTIALIEALHQRTPAPLSIDTRKPKVARAAVAAGASCWNDVSALTFAEDSIETAVALQIPVVLMHAQGDPKTMQVAPSYQDVLVDVQNFLVGRMAAAVRAGVLLDNIVFDPGIGFGKTLDHNLMLMRDLARLIGLGRPVLFGASRKSFIGKLDGASASERLGGSLAAALWAARQGARILRVHDVKETAQALKVWAAINEAGQT
jgi:dihydropteroate synthase